MKITKPTILSQSEMEKIHARSLVIDPWIIDRETQKPRGPLLAGVARNTRLGDASDNVSSMYRMDMPPSDVCLEEACIAGPF